MLDPYEGGADAMSGSMHAQSRMIVDHKFHHYSRIESLKATERRRLQLISQLHDGTVQLANSFGYFPRKLPMLPHTLSEGFSGNRIRL